jgi:N-acetylglucosamine-6-sulfatase
VKFIRNTKSPFFLLVTPYAVHDETGFPIPAPKDVGHFSSLKFPEREDFNERDVRDKPGFIRELPLLKSPSIRKLTAVFQARRETGRAVDRMVRSIEHALGKTQLSNTYIVFTSDNGFSLGAHRWTGKDLVYDESSRVPLIISGPGVVAGKSRALVNNLDLTATILDLAGASASVPLDGKKLKPLLSDVDAKWRSALLMEGNHSSLAVRTSEYLYVEHRAGNQPEYYDLKRDAFLLKNKPKEAGPAKPVLNKLKKCIGAGCWISQ